MRSISFINGAGATLALGNDTYNIESVDGLGIPDPNIQEQGGPGQDGTTYIDTTLQPREINVVVNVRKPNDYPAIDTCRRELVSKLNPKNGEGIITYTTEGGAQYEITGNPTVVFENKSYSEPFLRASIRFRCADPYWRETTDTTVTLEKTFSQPDNTMIVGDTRRATMIQQPDGTYRVVYIRVSDSYLVQRTSTDLNNWSDESVINGAITWFADSSVSLLYQSNGTIRVVYTLNASAGSRYLVQRTSSDNGLTWSSESFIDNTGDSLWPCIIQQSDNTFRVSYLYAGAIVQKTSSDGVTWSSRSTIVAAADRPGNIIQLNDNSFAISYILTGPISLYVKTSSDGITWSAGTSVTSPSGSSTPILYNYSSTFFIMYISESDGFVKMKSSSDLVTWSSEYDVNNISSTLVSLFVNINGDYVASYETGINIYYRLSQDGLSWGGQANIGIGITPAIIRQQNNIFRIVYKRTSDSYLVQKTSSDGTTWSAESVITSSAITGGINLLQDQDGLLRVFYIPSSDSKIKQKTSVDGITWSSELSVNSSITPSSSFVSIIQQYDGDFRVIYMGASSHIYQMTSSDGYLWSSGSLVSSVVSSYVVIKQLADGVFILAYRRNADSNLIIIKSTDGLTWSSEQSIYNGAAPGCILQKTNGDVLIFSQIVSNSYSAYQSSSDTVSWSTPSIIYNNSSAFGISAIQEQDGIIRSIFAATNSSILQYVSSVPYTITSTGDVPVPCTIRVDGPAVGPRIDELVTGNYIKLTNTISNGDYAEITTAFGNKKVTLVEGGITKNGSQYLDIGSTFFSVEPGSKVTISDDSASPLTATMTYTERYAGI